MLRSGAPRAALRAINSSSIAPRTAFNTSRTAPNLEARLMTAANTRSRCLAKPLAMSVTRFYSKTPAYMKDIDKTELKHERDLQNKKLSAHPELVSAKSSTHQVFGELGTKEPEDETDMLAGIKSDLGTIRETFSLKDVPREAKIVGAAGVVPYLATSLSTVYCAWEINHAHETGTGLLMSEHTAELLLHVIEPLQIGWGAVIISFLGAIHWGLEWANYGGYHSYRRYAIGIVAPAVAWPTTLLPVEEALIFQFLAFNFLYYADSRATKRGLAPPWYAVYRFVLTFVVGASIVVSLVGRGQIADRIGKLPGPADRIRALREAQATELEREEEQRRKATAESEEDAEEEGSDDEE